MAYPIYPNFFAFVGDEKDQLPVATPYILPLSTLIATDLFVEWYVVVTYAACSRSLFFPGAVLLSTAFVVNAKYSLPAYIKICITYNYVLTIPYYQQIVNINIVYSNYIYELCIFMSNISIDILYNISYPNIERRIT